MVTIIILGVLVGLDNLQLASAIGLAGLDPKRRLLLVVAFVFFEVSMPLLGMLIGHRLNSDFEFVAEILGPVILIALGLYILIKEFFEKEDEEKKSVINKGWLLLILPLVMSFDNLIAGIGLGTSGYPVISTSIVVGICAGSMCLIGLFIGEKLRKLIPANLEMLSGFYFIGLALVLIFSE